MSEMKQQLSALMDGEMDTAANPHWLESVIHQEEVSHAWRTYHIIGDALRGDAVSCNVSAAVKQKLQSEPVVLAPKPRVTDLFGQRRLTSMAASVAAVAFVGWVVWQAQGTSPQPSLAQNSAVPVEQAALHDKMDDYMLAHHEYASANPMRYGVEIKNAALSESGN